MAVKLKDIRRQVVVITGAGSGIGLTTARTASRSGAKVVLAARNEEALRNLADEIHAGGGCSRPTTGAWCTGRWSRWSTCGATAGRS
jgi:NADP-dependent 3-hydroxy acid dehydrogenase YdfG